MAAAVLLRSAARKMSRAAATTHHRSRSGPANSNQIQQGTADVLVSAGMAAATGLRSGAGWFSTKLAQAPPPPPPYHRLIDGRGIHSRTSPNPIPSRPKKSTETIAKATAAVAYTALAAAAVYMHYWVKPKLDEVTAMFEDLRKEVSQFNNIKVEQEMVASAKVIKKEAMKKMHSLENHVKELEAENTKLMSALDAARSQGKV